MGSEPKTLFDLVRVRADTHPEHGYHFIGDGSSIRDSLTYMDLDRSARSIASMLRARGARPGDRALLVYPPGLDFVRAFWACFYAGIVAVPMPTPHAARLPRAIARVRAIAADCGAKIVLTASTRSVAIRDLLEHAPGLVGTSFIETDRVDPDFGDWQAPELVANDVAVIQYTSGSTRAARGVVLTHANLLHNLGMLKRFHLNQDLMVMVSWLPLHHDMGLIRGMMSPLHMGGDCFLMSPLDFIQRPATWLEAITKYGGTTTGAPNFGYELCTRKIEDKVLGSLRLSTLRVAFCTAEPIRKQTVERFVARFSGCGFSRAAFRPSYGLAEATVLVVGELGDGPEFVRAQEPSSLANAETAVPGGSSNEIVSCGQVLGGQEVLVVNENLERSPVGQVGEIWVSGPSVAQRYLDREEETRETFHAHLADGAGPYLRTGDLGFFSASGGLCVVGRKRDLIIVRGQNYHPHELEATVERAAPMMRPGCSAAFGIEQDGTERVVVLCELDGSEEQLDFGAVVAAVRGAVSEEYDLSLSALCVFPRNSIPKTTSGKVQRSLARHLYLESSISALFAWPRQS